MQGGPLMHVIAAKAVAFLEALQPEFVDYQKQTVANARTLAAALMKRGYDVVSGGTDNHLFLLSLVSKNVTGKDADAALGQAHITVNKNSVPNDPRPPMITSGLRLGSPAITTRGFKAPEVEVLAGLIADVLDNLSSRAHTGSPDGKGGVTADPAVLDRVRAEVGALCRRFPVYRA